MDEKAQKDGERRVREHLVEKLERMGLMRPAGMKIDKFEAMQDEICQRLAYMTEAGLQALAEDMSGRGGGKDGDRFPLATKVLERARVIEPPVADASPLIRKVFASGIGEDALSGGYAPELMEHLRRDRKWPSSYVIGQIREKASDVARRASQIAYDRDRDRDISAADAAWMAGRERAVKRCRDARDLGLQDQQKGAA